MTTTLINASRYPSRLRLRGLLATLLLTTVALGCGGGGGTPPIDDTGTITGTITIDPSLPTSDGRGSSRVIDPGDTIAGLPAPQAPSGAGTVTFPDIPVVQRALYLEVSVTPTIDLDGSGTPTPIQINLPVRVGQGTTTTASPTLSAYSFGGSTLGVQINTTYTGPDGARTSMTVVNFRDRTVTHDLNGDGSFDDNWAPDQNLDGLPDDRNTFDDNPGGFTEITRQGGIEGLTNESITVAGATFVVNGATNIFNKDTNAPLQMSDFRLGDVVDVRGFQVGADLIADRIRLDNDIADDDPVDPSRDDEVEREGQLQFKGSDTLVVLNVTFKTNASTVYENKVSGGALDFAALQLGQFLEIEGYPEGNQIVASRVELEDESSSDFEIQREGRIDAITPTSIDVLDKLFVVDGSTRTIDKETEAEVPYSALTVGEFVRVKGQQVGDVLTATEIRVDRGGVNIEREGRITALTGETLTVLGVVFLVTGSTEIEDHDTGPIPFSALQLDDFVEVEGVAQGGTNTATTIERDNDD